MIAPNSPQPEKNPNRAAAPADISSTPAISEPQKIKFLRSYAKSKSVAAAAKSLKIKPATHYAWMRKDSSYRKLFEQLEALEGDTLEPERDPQKLMGDSATARSDARMVAQAIRNKWDIPENAFSELPKKMLDIANATNADDRSRIAATRVIAAMHGQNNADDPPAQEHNVRHSGSVRVIEDNDWYGNSDRITDRISDRNSDRVVAEATVAPGASAAIASEIQNPSVRSTMGKNGNGHSSGN